MGNCCMAQGTRQWGLKSAAIGAAALQFPCHRSKALAAVSPLPLHHLLFVLRKNCWPASRASIHHISLPCCRPTKCQHKQAVASSCSPSAPPGSAFCGIDVSLGNFVIAFRWRTNAGPSSSTICSYPSPGQLLYMPQKCSSC